MSEGIPGSPGAGGAAGFPGPPGEHGLSGATGATGKFQLINLFFYGTDSCINIFTSLNLPTFCKC